MIDSVGVDTSGIGGGVINIDDVGVDVIEHVVLSEGCGYYYTDSSGV